MNTMKKTITLALCAMSLSTAALAQTALQQLKFQAGESAVAAASQIETVTGAPVASQPLMIPRDAKDVLGACQTIDAKAFSLVAWTLPQAVDEVQACLNKTYGSKPGARRAYSVTATAARFQEVAGIKISVAGRILTGDSVLMDLSYSLQKRAGKVMGYQAILDSQAAVAR